MTQEELAILYALLQGTGGKDARAKLNTLKSMGIDLFGTNQPDVPDYVAGPAPTLANPWEVYGGDEKVRGAYNLLAQGVDPVSAMKQVGLQDDPLGTGPKYLDILTNWYKTEVENQAKMQDYTAQQDYYKAKAEAKAAAGAKPTIKDITGQTQYDVMTKETGTPLTAENLLQQYALSNKKSPAKMFHENPKINQYLQEHAKNTVNMLLEASKRRYVPTEAGQAMLDQAALTRLLGG